MHRRTLLGMCVRLFGAAPLAALAPERLEAVARSVHHQAASGGSGRVLDERQAETVATIAEHIIPTTDTPGARSARVEGFVDVILAEWYEDEEKSRFLTGLADLNEVARQRFGREFLDTDAGQQVALLSEADAELGGILEAGGDARNHFFGQMKWLTLYGYYTSEIGQTQELQVEMLPGYYDGCAAVKRDTPGGW